MVGRVGVELRLEAQAVTLTIHAAGLADGRAVQQVARVELKTGSRRVQLEDAARYGILEARRRPKRAGCAVHDEIVIVAARYT